MAAALSPCVAFQALATERKLADLAAVRPAY
jgi:hypothetical protein